MAKTVSAVVCVVQDSSTAVAAGSKPKDDGWKASKVLWRKAAAAVVTAEAMLRIE